MDDGTIGEIRMFAGNFAPRGWLFCQGQTLSISEYEVLYSVLGVIYGGNGSSNFMLPNLCARAVIGSGQGQNLTNRVLGQSFGAYQNTLTMAQMPAHTHTVAANNLDSSEVTPGNNYPAQNADQSFNYASTTDSNFAAAAVSPEGGNQPIPNLQPYLGMNYIICFQGVYPEQN